MRWVWEGGEGGGVRGEIAGQLYGSGSGSGGREDGGGIGEARGEDGGKTGGKVGVWREGQWEEGVKGEDQAVGECKGQQKQHQGEVGVGRSVGDGGRRGGEGRVRGRVHARKDLG